MIARCFPPDAEIIEVQGQPNLIFAIAVRPRTFFSASDRTREVIRLHIPPTLLDPYLAKPRRSMYLIDKAVAQHIRQQLSGLQVDRTKRAQVALSDCLEHLKDSWETEPAEIA